MNFRIFLILLLMTCLNAKADIVAGKIIHNTPNELNNEPGLAIKNNSGIYTLVTKDRELLKSLQKSLNQFVLIDGEKEVKYNYDNYDDDYYDDYDDDYDEDEDEEIVSSTIEINVVSWPLKTKTKTGLVDNNYEQNRTNYFIKTQDNKNIYTVLFDIEGYKFRNKFSDKKVNVTGLWISYKHRNYLLNPMFEIIIE